MPLTKRSTGSSAWRSSSTTAPAGVPTSLPIGIRLRPSSAQTRTWIARSDSSRPDGLGPVGRARSPRYSAPSSSSAFVMRMTNAFGTSWTRRHGRPKTVNTPDVMCAASSWPSSASSATTGPCVSGGAISTSVPSTSLVASRGRGHHLVHRLADGGQLELGELVAVVLRRLLAHHRGGQRARALERHDEDVAAGDAVDVRDARGDGRGRDGRRAGRRPARRSRPARAGPRRRQNICRMPATASEVDSPRRIRASSAFIGRPPRGRGSGRRACGRCARGGARCTGHLVGEQRDAVGRRGRRGATTSPGLRREHLVDGHVACRRPRRAP